MMTEKTPNGAAPAPTFRLVTDQDVSSASPPVDRQEVVMKALEYWRDTLTENATLRDALQGCLDWIEENCPDPVYPYCVTEGRAALKGIGVVRADGVTEDDKNA